MPQSLAQVYVHIIFHVKNSYASILPKDKEIIHQYINGLLHKEGCVPIIINGTNDHIHILCVLSKTNTLSDIIKIIKSISSKWIKTLDRHYSKFSWQRGYGVFSVSPSVYNKTIQYITNQEEYHRRVSTKDEFIIFLKKYQVEYSEEYLWDE